MYLTMHANEETETRDDAQQAGASFLLRSILAGIVVGTAANVTALLLGYSIWVALLCHSLFGAAAMGLVLLRAVGSTRQTGHAASTRLSARVETARH